MSIVERSITIGTTREFEGVYQRIREKLEKMLEQTRLIVAQSINFVVNPPYPTEDGKPLEIQHWQMGDSGPVPIFGTPQEAGRLFKEIKKNL